MKKIAIAIYVIFFSANVAASEIEYEKACDLKRGADAALTIRVDAGRNACIDKNCYGAVYEATLLDTGTEPLKSKHIQLSSSENLDIGSVYLIFAKIVDGKKRYTFYSQGYEISYTVPSDVKYFIPQGAAFLRSGSEYTRRMPSLCSSDVPDCVAFRAVMNAAVTSANVAYPNFEAELKGCK